MKKYLAEFIGTFALVFGGVGAAVLAGAQIGNLGVGLCFGFVVMAVIYALGNVSGAHLNPAVSIGMWTAGRIDFGTFVKYVVGQFLGAIVASLVIWTLALGAAGGYDIAAQGLGQNGWGEGFNGGYSIISAILFEFIATLCFVRIILEVTETKTIFAGVIIGFTLALLLMIGMNITNGSLNPARSFGPALLVGGKALSQVWLFLVVPTIAGAVAGIVHKNFGFNKQ